MIMGTTESTQTRNSDFQMPPFRPLKVYAFDPTRGRTFGNHMTINTQFERLEAGPVGRYLEVIDYDASNKCYYQIVNLDDPRVLLRNGLDPDESDPQFHQQMVYAVASETIRRFEYALGRNIRWSFSRPGNHGRHVGKKSGSDFAFFLMLCKKPMRFIVVIWARSSSVTLLPSPNQR
jgi:hypothetical protein